MCFDTIEINQVYCAYILVCANLYKVMQVDSNGHNLGMMAVITRLGKNTFRVNKLFVQRSRREPWTSISKCLFMCVCACHQILGL